MEKVITKLASVFLSKKKIIGWVSAVLMVVGASVASLSTNEFKEAVCGAPLVSEGE